METAPAKVPFSFVRTESRFRDREGVSLSLRAKKVTKETLRLPRADALRTPVPCAPRPAEGRCGNSLLRHPHLFALAGPAVLGSLEGGLEGQDQEQQHPRMA